MVHHHVVAAPAHIETYYASSYHVAYAPPLAYPVYYAPPVYYAQPVWSFGYRFGPWGYHPFWGGYGGYSGFGGWGHGWGHGGGHWGH